MKTVSVKVRITPQDLQQIDSCASQLQITRSELIRRYIDVGMNQKNSTKLIVWDTDEDDNVLENLQRRLSVINFRIDNYSVSTTTARPKERLNESLMLQHLTGTKDVEFSL